MTNALMIFGAIGLGMYSAIGLHFYSILLSRTKNGILRFVLPLAACALFIFGGVIGCAKLLDIPFLHGDPSSHSSTTIRFAVPMTWIGVVWCYLIMNWQTFKKRIG
jgi:hypothetical protein